MPRLLLAIASLALITQVSSAQEPVIRVNDPRANRQQIEATIYRTLFEGIALSPEQEQRARAIIAKENGEQLDLRRGDPELWEKRKRLNFVRDSTLRLLLHRPEDLERFDRQSAKLRPQGELPRRRP